MSWQWLDLRESQSDRFAAAASPPRPAHRQNRPIMTVVLKAPAAAAEKT
jgi:hypothetical protein